MQYLGLIKVDWTLLDIVNDRIASEENVYDDHLDRTQQAGYTMVKDCFDLYRVSKKLQYVHIITPTGD